MTPGSEYIRMLLDVLGDRDPLPIHASTPLELERAVAGLSDAEVRRAEKPGKWSVLQVVQHLADSDLVYGYRIRMIVAEPGAAIQGYDQDRWAHELAYDRRDLADALAEFRSLRESNVRLLRSLDDARLNRFGHHSERGKESVAQMLKLYAAHDLVHLKQIARIRKVVSGQP